MRLERQNGGSRVRGEASVINSGMEPCGITAPLQHVQARVSQITDDTK